MAMVTIWACYVFVCIPMAEFSLNHFKIGPSKLCLRSSVNTAIIIRYLYMFMSCAQCVCVCVCCVAKLSRKFIFTWKMPRVDTQIINNWKWKRLSGRSPNTTNNLYGLCKIIMVWLCVFTTSFPRATNILSLLYDGIAVLRFSLFPSIFRSVFACLGNWTIIYTHSCKISKLL